MAFWTIATLAAAFAAYYIYCLLKVKALAAALSPERTAGFVFGSGAALFCPLQDRKELGAFLEYAAAARPRTVLEIGRAWGGTLACLCSAAAPDALIISLDYHGSRFSGPLGFVMSGFWKRPLWKASAAPGQTLHTLTSDSHSPATFSAVSSILAGRPVDLLFIDGDHSYAGVKADHATYAKLLAPGGAVVFHDINTGPERFAGGVPEYWAEISKAGGSKEFVAGAPGECFGIGVLRDSGPGL